MTSDRERYRVELDVDAGAGARRERAQPEANADDGRAVPSDDEPFCIALLGDFSGRANREARQTDAPLASRRAVRVDRDSVDAAIGRFAPELRLAVKFSERPLTVRVAELDDFHPDRLYERLPHFQALREARARAAAPASMQQPAPAPERTASAPRRASRPASSGSLLDDILGDSPEPPVSLPSRASASTQAPEADALSEFVRRAVEPHLVHGPSAHELQLVAPIDAAIADHMRDVLHRTALHDLESVWRSVDFLVRRLDTGDALRVYLVDVTKEELRRDLLGGGVAGDLERSGAHRLLVDASVGTPGAPRWALLVGLYEFGADEDDARLLAQLAEIAKAAGAPWVAAASPPLAGTPSFDAVPDPDDWGTPSTKSVAAWRALREGRGARYVGLVAPRFLLRLPYGARTERCERLTFEEIESAESSPHERYLWGNGAVACALLLGEAFAESGWTLRPQGDIGGLPMHVASTREGPVAKPCAEALLTQRAAQRMMEAGIMPLASMKDGDAVRLVRFQSIAEPLAALAGRWTGGWGQSIE